MRQLILLILSFVTFVASAAPPPASPPQVPKPPTTRKAPAQVVYARPVNDKESEVGIITADAAGQGGPGSEFTKPNALSVIRENLRRDALESSERAKKDGFIKTTNMKFAPESMAFFIAIGAVTFNSMWIKSHGDPLAMQRHIDSLKDPVAHLSFYAFMQAQGFYMDARPKFGSFRNMDAITQRRMMKRFAYTGMAIGSLASSIVADLGHSVLMCVDQWVKGKTDETSLAKCNEAWATWTLRDKFSQYFPQIISMWATIKALEVVNAAGAKITQKVMATSAISGLLESGAAKAITKITAADVVLVFVGGGWVVKSIKFVGAVTNAFIFVSMSDVATRILNRPLNNIILPMGFNTFDVGALETQWRDADKVNWDQGQMKNIGRDVKDGKQLAEFEKSIENFNKNMQGWRNHLNEDAEHDINAWLELTQGLLNQADFAYKYYKGFSNYMFEYLNLEYRISRNQIKPEDVAAARLNVTGFPFTKLPFFDLPNHIGIPDEDYNEFYLTRPKELAAAQQAFLVPMATDFYKNNKILNNSQVWDSNKQLYRGIMTKIMSNNTEQMSLGVYDMRSWSEDILVTWGTWGDAPPPYDSIYGDLLKPARAALAANPVNHPFASYSAAFLKSAANKKLQDEARFDLGLSPFGFNNAADFMFYQMVCGRQQAYIDHPAKFDNTDFMPIKYMAPSMLNPGTVVKQFCEYGKNPFPYDKVVYGKTLKDFFMQNINWGIIGDYRSEDPNATNAFEVWWNNNSTKQIESEMAAFDVKFQKNVSLAYDNFFGRGDAYKKIMDVIGSGDYLAKNMQDTFKFETNVYLQLLSRALTNRNVPMPGNKDHLPLAKKSMDAGKFETTYPGLAMTPELIQLNNLFNGYYDFMTGPSSQFDFDKVILHAKKVDTQINNILVQLKLKKMIAAAPATTEEAAAATGSENSDSTYEDAMAPNGLPFTNGTMNYQQRVAVVAIKNLRFVESELRRFIRMRALLKNTLTMQNQEFEAGWKTMNPPIRSTPKSPLGFRN